MSCKPLGRLLAALAVAWAHTAGGIVCSNCASEWTQLANNVQLVEQLATQLNQYELLLRNAQRLDSATALRAIEDFRRLVDIVKTTRGVAITMGDVDDAYRREYPGYGGYEGDRSEPLAARYRRWDAANRESIRAALRAANLHAAQFRDEQATLRALERRALDATGTMQVMQAAAQIAVLQVQEMRQLRALLGAQIQMQANIAAVAADRQAAAEAADERSRARSATPPLGESSGGLRTTDRIRQ